MADQQVSTYAVVANGIVTNIILWDGLNDWAPQAGSEAIAIADGADVGPGCTYQNGVFGPIPNPPSS